MQMSLMFIVWSYHFQYVCYFCTIGEKNFREVLKKRVLEDRLGSKLRERFCITNVEMERHKIFEM